MVLVLLVSSRCFSQYYYDRSKLQPKVILDTARTRDFSKYLSIGWDFNTPLSNTHFINTTSAAGIRLSYRKKLSDMDNLWVGYELGAVSYSQYFPYQTYYSTSSAVSSDFYNYTTVYSLACAFEYFFLPMERKIVPFAGLSVGAAATDFKQYYNVNKATDNVWGMQLRPELGILASLKKNSSWKLKLAAHLDYASNTSKLAKNNFFLLGGGEYKNFVNVGFQVGVVRLIKGRI